MDEMEFVQKSRESGREGGREGGGVRDEERRFPPSGCLAIIKEVYSYEMHAS